VFTAARFHGRQRCLYTQRLQPRDDLRADRAIRAQTA
jgi:hypothetical protein